MYIYICIYIYIYNFINSARQIIFVTDDFQTVLPTQ